MQAGARGPGHTRTRPTTERIAQRNSSRWRGMFGRRRISPAIVILAITAVLFATNFVHQVVRQAQLERYREQLAQQIAQLQRTNDNLAAQAAYFESDDYAELVAREQFGYARPGDVVMMPTFPERGVLNVPMATTTAPSESSAAPQPNWVNWFQFLFANS